MSHKKQREKRETQIFRKRTKYECRICKTTEFNKQREENVDKANIQINEARRMTEEASDTIRRYVSSAIELTHRKGWRLICMIGEADASDREVEGERSRTGLKAS